MATELPIAKVRFNMVAVALYLAPEGEEIRARHVAIKLSRDASLGEDDPNVRYVRALERAANEAREAVSA